MSKRTGSAGGNAGANGAKEALRALDKRVPLEDLLARLGQRDRVNIERHLAVCREEPDPRHAELWMRLARALGTLTSLAATTTGQTAVSFFIPDGKYRMQVFAMEDNRDGKVLIYVPDVLDDALAAGVINKPQRSDAPDLYRLGNDPDQAITVEALSAANTPNPANFYKHMLGWNRKALRVSLPVDASEEQIVTAEAMCALASSRWVAKAAS